MLFFFFQEIHFHLLNLKSVIQYQRQKQILGLKKSQKEGSVVSISINKQYFRNVYYLDHKLIK